MPHYTAIFSFIAFSCSLLALRSRQPYFYWLSAILFLTTLNEWFLIKFLQHQFEINPNATYNVFSFLDISCWILIFYLIIPEPKYKKWVLIQGAVILLFSIIELIYWKNWRRLHTESFRFYNLSMLIFCLMYLLSKIKLPYYKLTGDPKFWICTACFFYHIVLFTSFTLHSKAEFWVLENAKQFYAILHFTGNLFYYTLLSVACMILYFKSPLKSPD